jgi:hypothetical protein
MTITGRLSGSGRRVLARAGTLASDAGARALDDLTLLAALAEEPAVARLLGVDPAAVRDEVRAGRGRSDHELLATLGIDLDRVRGQARRATGYRVDDPARWRLRRPALLPLRLRLTGPTADLVLTEPARKAVEVAVYGGKGPVGELDLLRGLLADSRTPAVRALTRLEVNLCRVAAVVFGRRRRPDPAGP